MKQIYLASKLLSYKLKENRQQYIVEFTNRSQLQICRLATNLQFKSLMQFYLECSGTMGVFRHFLKLQKETKKIVCKSAHRVSLTSSLDCGRVDLSLRNGLLHPWWLWWGLQFFCLWVWLSVKDGCTIVYLFASIFKCIKSKHWIGGHGLLLLIAL